MIQEHNLVEMEAKKAEVIANIMDITARFSPAPKSGRGGGTAILIKQALVSDINLKVLKGGQPPWRFLKLIKNGNFFQSTDPKTRPRGKISTQAGNLQA